MDDVLAVTGVRVVIVACVEIAVGVEDDVLDGGNTHCRVWAVRHLRKYPCLVLHYSTVSALVFCLFAVSYAQVVENKCNSSLALRFLIERSCAYVMFNVVIVT